MARSHFRDERARHVVRGEGAALLGDDRVEEYLKEDVSELLPNLRVGARPQRVVELVRLLEQIGTQRCMCLRGIPIAPRSQIAHDGERIFKRRLVLHGSSEAGYTTRPSRDASMQDSEKRAWVEIDLGALQRNAAAIAHRARAPLLPMIKADAYGLGAIPVARALEPLDPWGYGVATILAGLELRAAEITRPLVIFTPLGDDELRDVRAAGLTPSLSRANSIDRWRVEGGGPWHLAVDTGMSRAGVRWDEVGALRDVISRCPPEGVYTHFHSAELNDRSLDAQEDRFRRALDALPERPRVLHVENSAGVTRRNHSPWSCVRPGIFLYGVGSGEGSLVEPEPVIHVRARVIDLRRVRDGETVSYDATYRAVGDRQIATLGIGYADGYPRALSNRGCVLLGGRRVCIAGVVTMDMTMVDTTEVPCALGDVASVIGGDPALDVATVARTAEMSPYELLTGLRGRLARVYLYAGMQE